MGHLYHGYVSHNQRVAVALLPTAGHGGIPKSCYGASDKRSAAAVVSSHQVAPSGDMAS